VNLKVCVKKSFYYTAVGVSNMMKTTDNGIIVSQQTASGHLSNTSVSHCRSQRPRSSNFIVLNVWLKASQWIMTGYRLRGLGLNFGKERIISFAISTSQSLFLTQVCGRIEADNTRPEKSDYLRSDNRFRCLRSNYVSPGQTRLVLFCVVCWMTHRAPLFAMRKNGGTGKVSVWFWL
jgi:hypothetical protein